MSVASVRTYLKKSVENAPGFKEERYARSFSGIALSEEKGFYYAHCFDFGDRLPEDLKRYFDHFEVHVYWPFNSNGLREKGIYKRGGAYGTLDVENDPNNKGNLRYELVMRGKDLIQLYNLYEAIRTGTIRPTKSFNGAQGGKSRAELEQEIVQLRKDLKLTQADFLELAADAMERNEQLAAIRKACEKASKVHAILHATYRQSTKKLMRGGIEQAIEAIETARGEWAEAGIMTGVAPNR
jgi:DNA-binding transcriptional regulator YiaG